MDHKDLFIDSTATAPIIATIITNPFEVIKVRLQLQGELRVRGTYTKIYTNILKSFATIVKNEGLSGLQKGLVPAILFQLSIDSFRSGINKIAKEYEWTKNENGDILFTRDLFFGATGEVLGSMAASPFYLIKIQLQSRANKQQAFKILKENYLKNGFKTLWNGTLAGIPRATLGSGGHQIATFDICKSYLKKNNFVVHPILNQFAAGLITGSVMSLAITPPDVIGTRLYNQGTDIAGKGIYYNGLFDCLVKILKTEGIGGLYKGFWPNYIRISTHLALTALLSELFSYK